MRLPFTFLIALFSAAQAFSQTSSAPVINSAPSLSVIANQQFTYQITTVNNDATAFTVQNFPDGLVLETKTGAIRGSVDTSGEIDIVLIAINANGTGKETLALMVTPQVTLQAPVPEVVTGSGQSGEFLITRTDGDLSDQLTVNYRVKGSAANGEDYALLSGTKRIKAGKVNAKIKVYPNDDAFASGETRTVALELLPGDGYAVGTAGKVKTKISGH